MLSIYGATGYSGKLIAQTCVAAGVAIRIAGRAPAALAALASELGDVPWIAADPHQPASLAPVVAGSRLVINAAGPWSAVGSGLARAAVLHGAHYLDLSNEIAAVQACAAFAPLALARGVALVPAAGLEVTIADCAVAALAQHGADHIEVAYAWPQMRTHQGARHTMPDLIGAHVNALRQGQPVRLWAAAQAVDDSATAARGLLRLGGGELWTVPQHCAVATLDVGLLAPIRSAQILALLTPAIRLAAHSPGRGLLDRLVDRLFPALVDDHEGDFMVRSTVDHQRLTVRGAGPYATTAQIVALLAEQLLDHAWHGSGVLPPSQVLDPAKLWAALAARGASISRS